MKSVKVYFVTETFFPAKMGGTEVYVLNLCKELIQFGVKCKVFCTGNVHNVEQYDYENVPVEVVPASDDSSLLNRLLVAKVVEGFDVLHIHSYNGQINNRFLLCLQRLGLAIFFTPHLVNNFCGNNNGSLRYRNSIECNGIVKAVKCQTCTFYNHKELPFFYRSTMFHYIIHKVVPGKIARKVLSKQHFAVYEKMERIKLLNKQEVQVIALSPWYGELLRKNNLKKVTVIMQGVGADFLSHQRKTKAPQLSNSIRWIFIGRMSDEKGVKDLISAFVNIGGKGDSLKIVSFHPDVKDDYLVEVEGMIKMDTRISVVYNQPSFEVARLLADADSLILPSKITEMAPLVIQEAIALKIPVLVSDFIRDDLESNRLGLKFFSHKKGDFEAKMNEMKTKVLTGYFNINSAFTGHSFSQIALKHISLYKQSLSARLISV